MDSLINKLGNDRITARQIDELVGLARGRPMDLNQDRLSSLETSV